MSPQRGVDAEGDEERYPLHALEYYWEEFEPHLMCYDESERGAVELDLEEVGLKVTEQKRCVGYWDDDGRYVPCPKDALVTKYSQCPECSKEVFLPFQDCLFEPECNGEKCGLEFCSREHILYLAFYDTRMKIGMSSSRRVEKRLIEQGADAYSIIGKYQGRKSARDAEKDLSRRLGIPQWYYQQDLLRNLSRPVDLEGIKGRLEGLKMTLGRTKGLAPEPLRLLTDYPIKLPLSEVPKLQSSPGDHSGSFVGIKGKWLIYEDGGLRALNLSDMPGRFIARHVA
jgi:hypothetical protein